MNQSQTYRMTRQRRLILDEIKENRSHPTADEIYEIVRKKMPHISMGTVYRNLDILVTCGLIQKLDPGHSQMRFDGTTRNHYHISCTKCGRIEDAPFKPSDNSLQNLENALGKLTKHGIFGHKLEFVGLCSNCMEEENESQSDKGGDLCQN